MQIEVADVRQSVDALLEAVEARREVVLTRDGVPVARLTPAPSPRRRGPLTPAEIQEREEKIRAIVERAAARALPGPDAARSQDFLYGEDGLPC